MFKVNSISISIQICGWLGWGEVNVIEGKLSVNMTYWIILFNWPLPSYAVILDKDDNFFQIEDEYKCNSSVFVVIVIL